MGSLLPGLQQITSYIIGRRLALSLHCYHGLITFIYIIRPLPVSEGNRSHAATIACPRRARFGILLRFNCRPTKAAQICFVQTPWWAVSLWQAPNNCIPPTIITAEGSNNKVSWNRPLMEKLVIILLGICMAWRVNLKATSAQMVYGQVLHLPGEFLKSRQQTGNVNTSNFVSDLWQPRDQVFWCTVKCSINPPCSGQIILALAGTAKLFYCVCRCMKSQYQWI